jgi:formylglycine-generating enzyme required for sulfatase activity
MVLIPAGSLQMGDSFNEGDSDERPVHTVTVSAFYMDVNDVTVGQWNAVATWASSHGYDLSSRSGSDNPGDQYPVVDVSWYEAVKWVNARSEKEGLTPCYYTDSSQSTVYRTGNVNVAIEGVKWSGCGYRLPTEAEWEKAARGGLSGQRYPWGNDIDCTKANYWPRPSSACVGHTTPVGSHPANGYGLYDMAGNIWQWVWDWYYSGYYSNSPGTDPRGSASGSSRVGRGGSWYCDAASCRVATRASLRPLPDPSPYFPLGFRLVRTAP